MDNPLTKSNAQSATKALTKAGTKPAVWRSAWVTGAGKGIGKSVAVELAQLGVDVYATARSAEDLNTLREECGSLPGVIIPCPLDIRDKQAIAQVFADHFEHQLPDLFILNAGTHQPFSAQSFSAEQAEQLWDVNLNGTVRCLDPILKACLKQNSGQIAITASVAGYGGLPTAAAYGASKAALINMAEALKIDLLETGVDLRVICPGFVRTPLTDKNDFAMPALMEPSEAAKRIILGLQKKGFEITFPRRFSWFLKALKLLPYSLYLPLMKKVTR